jgi:phage terminase large subunit GpA-like protein
MVEDRGPDPVAICDEIFSEAMRPDPVLTVSEWADANRILPSSSAEPGRYRTDRTPYIREIQDALGATVLDVWLVAVMAGAQVAKTTMAENWLGYSIEHSPAPFLFVEPTVDLAKSVSKTRVQPMIDECPALSKRVRPSRSRDSGNTILEKDFPGGSLRMTGANSAVGLRQRAVRRIAFDEVDAYPADVEGEGDPIELGMRRTATFARNRKILLTSTPKDKGSSRIEAAIERSDQRRYFVPCPECGVLAPILWRNIVWDKTTDEDGDEVHLPETARLRCEGCEAEIEERKKPEMLAKGEWVATCDGEPGIRGYLLSSLYSPLGWYSWADAVRDFLAAKKIGTEGLKTWVNTVLGETWEEEAEKLDPIALLSRREKYDAIVPESALVLTAGIDVQQNRIEMEVVGWGHGEESWGVDYRILQGDTDKPEVWEKLTAALGATYPWGSRSTARVGIDCAAIDAGYQTQMVYAFVRTGPANVFAVHGAAGQGRPIVTRVMRKQSGATKAKVHVYTVGVDGAKEIVFARLRREETGYGYCHFPLDRPGYGADFFSQLTAEKKVTKYRRGFAYAEWVKIRPRNEALDCRVYALAALHIRNPVFEAYESALRETLDSDGEKRPPVERPRSGGWVDDWR